jgi:hypothetical protein
LAPPRWEKLEYDAGNHGSGLKHERNLIVAFAVFSSDDPQSIFQIQRRIDTPEFDTILAKPAQDFSDAMSACLRMGIFIVKPRLNIYISARGQSPLFEAKQPFRDSHPLIKIVPR